MSNPIEDAEQVARQSECQENAERLAALRRRMTEEPPVPGTVLGVPMRELVACRQPPPTRSRVLFWRRFCPVCAERVAVKRMSDGESVYHYAGCPCGWMWAASWAIID